MIIAQISDLHVKLPERLAYEVVDTAAYLRRAIARLNALEPLPDLVLATGDLVDGGKPEEYAHLRELTAALEPPLYLVMGNHDDREALRAAFSDHGYLPREGPLRYVLELPLRIVVLDATRPGYDGGEMDAERLAWLELALAGERRPTVVVLHHPPFASGIESMDEDVFFGRAAFEEVVARHSHVERVLCGHLHRTMITRFAGTIASVCTSTAHQLVLAAHPPLLFTLEPPALHLHRWDGQRLITDVVPIDGDRRAYPFRRDGRLIE